MAPRGAGLAALLVLAACAPNAPPPAAPAPAASLSGNTPLPHILTVQGPYRHPASGMQFPTAVGAFQRTTVIQNDRDGLHVSAGYNLSKSPLRVAATVFVYPARAVPGTREAACRHEFATAVAEILRSYPHAALVEALDVVHTRGRVTHPGHLARFTYQTTFDGTNQPVASQMHLFCHVDGKWQVRYRFTHPVGDPAAEPDIAAFLQGLGWTLGGERASLDHSAAPAG